MEDEIEEQIPDTIKNLIKDATRGEGMAPHT
jgi:hypothetical protein